MINTAEQNLTNNMTSLLKILPRYENKSSSFKNQKLNTNIAEQYEIKISLDSVHYTGTDYGYGWTFVTSILKRHWITSRIQIKRGQKSLVGKDIYHNTVNTSFHNLQHLPISICAQHTSGFKIETTFRLKPNSFKLTQKSKSIYTDIGNHSDAFQFHELHTVKHEGVQFMFVLNIEINPKNISG